jgi:hypothetical protein
MARGMPFCIPSAGKDYFAKDNEHLREWLGLTRHANELFGQQYDLQVPIEKRRAAR